MMQLPLKNKREDRGMNEREKKLEEENNAIKSKYNQAVSYTQRLAEEVQKKTSKFSNCKKN